MVDGWEPPRRSSGGRVGGPARLQIRRDLRHALLVERVQEHKQGERDDAEGGREDAHELDEAVQRPGGLDLVGDEAEKAHEDEREPAGHAPALLLCEYRGREDEAGRAPPGLPLRVVRGVGVHRPEERAQRAAGDGADRVYAVDEVELVGPQEVEGSGADDRDHEQDDERHLAANIPLFTVLRFHRPCSVPKTPPIILFSRDQR